MDLKRPHADGSARDRGTTRRITVCQLPGGGAMKDLWKELCDAVVADRSDLVVLPELSLIGWICTSRVATAAAWDQAIHEANERMQQLAELCCSDVAGTRPTTTASGSRRNEGFLWSTGTVTKVHDKYYVPNEPDFWEGNWYEPGPPVFRTGTTSTGISVGFLICSETWFPERGREYGWQGAHLIVSPRATWASRAERWLVGGRAAAIISGCYWASSAKSAPASTYNESVGGPAWVVDPDGVVLCETSDDAPFATVEIDLERAEKAKASYPRYLRTGDGHPQVA